MRRTCLFLSAILACSLLHGQTPDLPVRVSGGVIAGNVIRNVQPVFPGCTLWQSRSGTAAARVIIGKDGHVKSAAMISGSEAWRQPFLDAIRQWVYRPYLLNGEPVEVETTIMMDISSGAPPPECASSRASQPLP